MTALSRPAARRLLWVSAVLLVPLPYVALATGSVPVVRFGLLAAVVGAYLLAAGGASGITWIVFGLLLLHAVAYAAMLAVAVRVVGRVLPDPVPAGPLVFLVVVASLTALALPVYHTPFDDVAAHTTWLGLFQ